MNSIGYENKRLVNNSGNYPDICLELLRNTSKNSEDSNCLSGKGLLCDNYQYSKPSLILGNVGGEAVKIKLKSGLVEQKAILKNNKF
jgi:hypothetical protein